MAGGFYQIIVPAEKLAKTNRRHDKAVHSVCMLPWVRYDGRFGYPPEKRDGPRLNRWLAEPVGD